jgi:hypothetical protein
LSVNDPNINTVSPLGNIEESSSTTKRPHRGDRGDNYDKMEKELTEDNDPKPKGTEPEEEFEVDSQYDPFAEAYLNTLNQSMLSMSVEKIREK